MTITCPCGETHDVNDIAWAQYCGVTAGLPPDIEIEVPAGKWIVPRLYFVKHTLTAQGLPALAAQYGWPCVWSRP